jgi:hypothetical protein
MFAHRGFALDALTTQNAILKIVAVEKCEVLEVD